MNRKPEEDQKLYQHYERPQMTRHALNRPKNAHHHSLWVGLIIVAIVIIALAPLIKSRFSAQNQVIEKPNTPIKKKKKPTNSKKIKAKKSIQKKTTPKKTTVQSASSTSQSSRQSSSQQSSQQSQAGQSNSQQTRQSSQTNTNSTQSSEETNSVNQNAKTTGKYIVQTGDSLSAIASHYGLTVSDLAQLNGLQVTNQLMPGQALKLK